MKKFILILALLCPTFAQADPLEALAEFAKHTALSVGKGVLVGTTVDYRYDSSGNPDGIIINPGDVDGTMTAEGGITGNKGTVGKTGGKIGGKLELPNICLPACKK